MQSAIASDTGCDGAFLFTEVLIPSDLILRNFSILFLIRDFISKRISITFSGVDIVEARNVRTNSGTVQTIVSPEGADYSFVGTYVRYVLRTDGTEYGLNSSNKLIRPSSSNIMRGLRAFFRIAGGSNSNAKVVIGGELTSIDEIDATANRATGVYHVSGHYVREDWDNGKGQPRGLYIVNGRKMVRK